MKKILIILLIFLSCNIYAQSQISNIRDYLNSNDYLSFIEIPLNDSIIKIYAKESQKTYYQDRFYLSGEIFVIAEDENNGKFNSHVICMFGSSAVSMYSNNHEFIIQTRSRSEIKGSREFIYYDEEFNRFTIFTSKWMFLNQLYINDEYIVCSMGNNSKYNYLIINKYTGEEQPLLNLPKILAEEYDRILNTENYFNLYDYIFEKKEETIP